MASAFNAQSDPGVVFKFFSTFQQSMRKTQGSAINGFLSGYVGLIADPVRRVAQPIQQKANFP